MPCTAQDLWDFGQGMRDESLVGDFHTTKARSSVSRGYYACYHWACAFLEETDQMAGRPERTTSHDWCWEGFYGLRSTRDIYRRGAFSHKIRVEADYYLAKDLESEWLNHAWLYLSRLKDSLDNLPTHRPIETRGEVPYQMKVRAAPSVGTPP